MHGRDQQDDRRARAPPSTSPVLLGRRRPPVGGEVQSGAVRHGRHDHRKTPAQVCDASNADAPLRDHRGPVNGCGGDSTAAAAPPNWSRQARGLRHAGQPQDYETNWSWRRLTRHAERHPPSLVDYATESGTTWRWAKLGWANASTPEHTGGGLMATWEEVSRACLALPATTERIAPDGLRSWRVRDKAFLWERPLRP